MLLGIFAGEWIAGDSESIAVFAGCAAACGVIGTFVHGEDWRRLPLSSVRVSLEPGPPGGYRVGACVVLRR